MSDESEEEEEAADPVDALADEVTDREGDPFESLAGAGLDDGEGDEPPANEEPRAIDEESTGRAPAETNSPDAAGVDGPGAAIPGQEPPEEVLAESGSGAPAGRVGDPFAAAERAFEEMDIADLDDDQVWASLDDAQASGSVTRSAERTVADVSKHSYCETCPHFSGPPEIHCTHEGTEILEFPDLETVRVVNCPIVAKRRSLQREQ